MLRKLCDEYLCFSNVSRSVLYLLSLIKKERHTKQLCCKRSGHHFKNKNFISKINIRSPKWDYKLKNGRENVLRNLRGHAQTFTIRSWLWYVFQHRVDFTHEISAIVEDWTKKWNGIIFAFYGKWHDNFKNNPNDANHYLSRWDGNDSWGSPNHTICLAGHNFFSFSKMEIFISLAVLKIQKHIFNHKDICVPPFLPIDNQQGLKCKGQILPYGSWARPESSPAGCESQNRSICIQQNKLKLIDFGYNWAL